MKRNMDAGFLPVVDLSGFGVGEEKNDDSKRKIIAEQIHQAFSTIGFVYLINHGIPPEQIDNARDIADRFFSLPVERKSVYLRQGNENHGWVPLEHERLNPDRPLADYKEAFNIVPPNAKKWPDGDVSGFQGTMEILMESCQELALTMLNMMAKGLKLEDENVFLKNHNIKSPKNTTTLRCLSYPPLPDNIEMKAGQARCGEHSDYGSITLLFQDGIGGLEVMNRHGIYQAATPIPGAVIVNIGDLMQRWTADQLVSTKHRVLITEDEAIRRAHRRSIAYFVQPDDDCLVECLDGSHKYPPITCVDYMKYRFNVTY